MLTVLFAAPFNISVAGEVQIQFGTFDLPPYAFYDGDGRGRGMLREINSEISDKAGLTHADRVMPLKRVHKELVKGDVACATFVPAPWSKSDLVQVAEITSELTSIIVPKKGLVISNFEDLHGLTMAIPRGSYSGMAVMTDPNIKRLLTNGYTQSAAILKAGRVDIIVGTDVAIYHSLGIAGVSKKEIGTPFVFLKSPLWLQCRKDVNPVHIAKLCRAPEQLHAEGVLAQIMSRYAPDYTE